MITFDKSLGTHLNHSHIVELDSRYVNVTGDTMTGNLTISNTAPSLVLTDTTASAKSLTIAVDANIVNFRESAGASGSLMVLDLANNRLGIGTAAPSFLFHMSNGTTPTAALLSGTAGLVYSSDASPILGVMSASNTANYRGIFKAIRARGSLDIPAAVAVNDTIMSFLGAAFDGTALQIPATIDMYVDGTVSSGAVPARISFVTGTNATTRAERLTIKNTGNVGIGTTSPDRLSHAEVSDTTTNAVSYAQRLTHICSTASTGLTTGGGVGLEFELETATDGTNQIAATIESAWVDATNATRKANLSFYAYDTAARLGLQIAASGSAAQIGFFGTTPAIQQTGYAVPTDLPTCIAALTALRTALINYGLITTV